MIGLVLHLVWALIQLALMLCGVTYLRDKALAAAARHFGRISEDRPFDHDRDD